MILYILFDTKCSWSTLPHFVLGVKENNDFYHAVFLSFGNHVGKIIHGVTMKNFAYNLYGDCLKFQMYTCMYL